MSTGVEQQNLNKLLETAKGTGVDLLSTARVDKGLREGFHRSIKDISRDLCNAVVMGIRLSAPVLETVVTAPTWTYYHHYRTVNMALDLAALRIAGMCQRTGYDAMPIPASQILDWDRLGAHLSHRELGARAGLGWWGRNNLLVNEDYGAQVRYTSVLTDMPLPERGAQAYRKDCGDCTLCIEICPVGAIREDRTTFRLDSCAAQLRRFSKSEKLNTLICGLCIKVCTGSRDRNSTEGIARL